MPARWQQWMPFKIDAFKSSPAVIAMHPAARAGYLYLLTFAWQTEDCTVPNDQMELAEISGLGDELWALHGPRILRKFEVLENGRLRNAACFEEWSAAEQVFMANDGKNGKISENRSRAGKLGAERRWVNGKSGNAIEDDGKSAVLPSKSDGKPMAKHGLTGTVTITLKDTDITRAAPIVPPEIDHHTVAREVVKRLKMSNGEIYRAVCTQAELEMSSGGFAQEEADGLVEVMCEAWRSYIGSIGKLAFVRKAQDFFSEGMWRDRATWPWKAEKNDNRPRDVPIVPQDESEARAYKVWSSMSEKYRASNPWKGPIPP
jgi:uncharacterized protein YdaU (DUF1376 family)